MDESESIQLSRKQHQMPNSKNEPRNVLLHRLIKVVASFVWMRCPKNWFPIIQSSVIRNLIKCNSRPAHLKCAAMRNSYFTCVHCNSDNDFDDTDETKDFTHFHDTGFRRIHIFDTLQCKNTVNIMNFEWYVNFVEFSAFLAIFYGRSTLPNKFFFCQKCAWKFCHNFFFRPFRYTFFLAKSSVFELSFKRCI